MTLERILEPEVMDTLEEAVDYDAMDHRAVNRLFVDHLLQAAQLAGGNLFSLEGADARSSVPEILDVGTGTAQIPIELMQRKISGRVRAIDLARQMLDLAVKNIAAAGLSECILPELVDAKGLPYPDGRFDLVMSNSIIHHIPRPVESLREMMRVTKPGGLLFVRDLMRPDSMASLVELVQRYAGDANAHQKKMFGESLHAALTLDEVRDLAEDVGLPRISAVATSDRHWTIAARR